VIISYLSVKSKFPKYFDLKILNFFLTEFLVKHNHFQQFLTNIFLFLLFLLLLVLVWPLLLSMYCDVPNFTKYIYIYTYVPVQECFLEKKRGG
jgi:hypothetical protein